MFKTPGGRISFASSTSLQVARGAYSEGLMTAVLPVRRAGVMCQTAIISGQFQGVMEATTPRGLRCTSTRAWALS